MPLDLLYSSMIQVQGGLLASVKFRYNLKATYLNVIITLEILACFLDDETLTRNANVRGI